MVRFFSELLEVSGGDREFGVKGSVRVEDVGEDDVE